MSRAPVSVVIPYYNGRETIQRAIDSLDRQAVTPSEIVVVDDGSRVAPFDEGMVTSRIPIQAITLPDNRGIPVARNAGVRAAGHPWIGFLDQDDEWALDKLERQWRVLEVEERRESVVVFGRLLMESGNGRPHLRPPRRAVRALELGGPRAAAAFVNHGNVLPLVTLLVARDVFERHGYLDEELRGGADDTELVLRLVGEGLTFRFDAHEEPGAWSVAHRYTGENYSDDAARWVADQLAFIPRLADRYPAIAPLKNAFLARSHFTLGRRHERRGETERAAREYAAASRCDPLWWRARVARARLYAPRGVRRVTERVWESVKEAFRESPGSGRE